MDLSSLRKVPFQNSVPLATVSPPDPTQRGPGGGPFTSEDLVADRPALLELLAGFLAVDQAVVAAYKVIIARASDPAIEPQLQEFLAQNQRQQDLVENIIRTLGGEPGETGETGRLARARIERMLEPGDGVVTGNPQALLETDLQVLVLMETERRDNGLFLEEIGPAIGDENASALVMGRIGDLNIEQELHVEWVLGVLNALRMRRLSLPEMPPGT